jgi:peptide/nickel transport system ATP-binding protein
MISSSHPSATVSSLAPVEDVGGPAQPLLSIRGLTRTFVSKGAFGFGRRNLVRAVSDVSFDVRKGETLGIVGESGCGKTTTSRLIMRLLDPDEGKIIFDGEEVGAERRSLREYRRKVQMVFQDSFASLAPRMTIEEAIAFPPTVHGVPRKQALAEAHSLLDAVGLAPAQFGARYPHQLSGGQRQRVNIARALALRPRLLVLDEPVSALDKSVEAQVLNLLNDLKRQFGLTYIFISHDLNVVQYISDRVLVMYLGKVAELGSVDSIFDHAAHPYTAALMASRPAIRRGSRSEDAPLSGDPPSPLNPPPGCRFHTRCAYAEPVCSTKVPPLAAAGADHVAACLMVEPGSGHSRAPLMAA